MPAIIESLVGEPKSVPRTETGASNLVEMSWDPITRIVGSLGIYTKIDFAKRKVVQCHSTSSIFRGYSIFMQNKDPRDAHFITSRICGVLLITGDTKVVDRGKCDQMFINTSGLGVVRPGVNIHPGRASTGDQILLNGPIAAHGIAIMSVREGLEFETQIASDTAPLNGLVEAKFAAAPDIHVLRDPTRGGVTSALGEIAEQARVGIYLAEANIPINEEVKGACAILGLDPLYVANEGKLLAIVSPGDARAVLAAMRAHPLGREAAVIGELVGEHPGVVTMKTRVGGTRVVDMLSGEQLPRIC